jgi:hypothetical protein
MFKFESSIDEKGGGDKLKVKSRELKEKRRLSGLR